jgi:diphosphomevalonate decarboxylase
MKSFETVWCAPSNIALVKYWGKKEGQIPQNPSLSFSLQNSTTTTSISALLSDKFSIEFEFEGKPSRKFKTRILKALKRWAQDFPELKDYAYKIKSSNTFPHSAGIASSASSMASLALCITELESKLIGVEDFYKRASYFARLASGSASRSIFGEYNVWGEIPSIGTSNQYSSVVYAHETLKQIGDFVLIVSSKEKAVSSSLGHQLMNYHPYASTRYEIARENIRVLLNALETGDWIGFGEIVENEALSLHALMMTSSPAVILLKPESLSIISRVQEFRVKNKIPLYFTIDAGPNIHLLYPLKYKKKVESFIQSDLLTFTEDGVYIDDQIGSGPYQP